MRRKGQNSAVFIFERFMLTDLFFLFYGSIPKYDVVVILGKSFKRGLTFRLLCGFPYICIMTVYIVLPLNLYHGKESRNLK